MRHLITTGLCALLSAITVGCSRPQDTAFEDAKTAGRHLARGIRALFGDLRDSRLVASSDLFEDSALDYECAYGSEEVQAQRLDLVPLAPEFTSTSVSIPGIEGFAAPTGGLEHVYRPIHFATDSYRIEGGENHEIVKAIARHLQQHPSIVLYVEGHCDQRGAALYNLSLGSKRANSLRAALIKAGIPGERLLTVSYGKERPLVLGNNAESWRLNRRAQFCLYQQPCE